MIIIKIKALFWSLFKSKKFELIWIQWVRIIHHWCQRRRHLQLVSSLDDWYKINQAINILANYKIKIKYLRKKYRVIFHIPLYNWIIPVIFCKQDIYNYRFFRYKHIFDIYENYYLYDYIYTLNQYIIAFVYIILYIFCYLCYNNIIL